MKTAETAWSAGFSRHPLRRAQRNDVRLLPAWRGQARRDERTGGQRSRPSGVPADEILPAARLGRAVPVWRPAFQAGGVIGALGIAGFVRLWRTVPVWRPALPGVSGGVQSGSGEVVRC